MGRQERVLKSSQGPTDSEDTPSGPAPTGSANDTWGLERSGSDIYELDSSLDTDPRNQQHFQLLRKTMGYWQAQDGFARVSLSVGTSQLVTMLAYFVLGFILVSNHASLAACLCVVIFMGISVAIVYLDMSLDAWEKNLAILLAVFGPSATAVCCVSWLKGGPGLLIKIVMPLVYLSHCGRMVFLLYMCKIQEVASGAMLPTGFRAILYTDVFGWIKRRPTAPPTRPGAAPLETPSLAPGRGPALQAVGYEDGRPRPVRVEQLPDSHGVDRPLDFTHANFSPTTFVPVEELKPGEQESVEFVADGQLGHRPWTVFSFMTMLFAVLFFLFGINVTLDLMGLTYVQVEPLLHAPGTGASLLGYGRELRTSWPHANVQPRGLSCGGLNRPLVAASDFGLYTAMLQEKGVDFKDAPFCGELEGETVQDVALKCIGEHSATCSAVTLHGQGKRLSTCALGGNATDSLASAIGQEWLGDAGETVQAVALTSQTDCGGAAGSCAYMATDAARILQMRLHTQAEQQWLPHRLLRSQPAETPRTELKASMHMINDRYLGFLRPESKLLEAIDLSHRGASKPISWSLPSPPTVGQDWAAMCAAGDALYLLSSGPSPQLWQFPVPPQLRDSPESDARRPAAPAATPSKKGHSSKGFLEGQTA